MGKGKQGFRKRRKNKWIFGERKGIDLGRRRVRNGKEEEWDKRNK